MLFLATAAALAFSPPPSASITRVGAPVQARAMVRIISAVTLRLGEGPLSGDAPPARHAIVHSDGGPHAAKLIEFE